MKKTKPKDRPKLINSRKAMRQQKRQQKKLNRQEHYSKKRNKQDSNTVINTTPGRFVKRPIDAVDINIEVKVKKRKVQPTLHDILSKERRKDEREVYQLKSQMQERRNDLLVKANEEEDKVIKKLEKQLGLNKTKNKTNLFTGDGLDYLLEVCDRTTQGQVVAAEKHLADVEGESDFDEDLSAVTGKGLKDEKVKKTREKQQENVNDNSDTLAEFDISDDEDDANGSVVSNVDDYDDDDLSTEEDSQLDDTNIEALKEVKKNNHIVMKSIKNTSSDNDMDSDSDGSIQNSNLEEDNGHYDSERTENDSDDSEKTNAEKPNDVWEDIYGRRRDKEGNIIKEDKGVYIPPHMRNKDSSSDKELAQLKRHIKSVLNKLSGTNLHWACTTLENLYSNNSRNSVNNALSELWLQATVQRVLTPDRLVAEHAAVVAVLQANVGCEIGAHFLQVLVKQFDDMLKTKPAVENKELDNLMSALAHLYGFKIYHATLLYDILTRLLVELSEKNIDCVLVALRTVGGVMRKEEPQALRSFIHDTQGKLTRIKDEAAAGSRIKFLLEMLLAVKNNNLTKIPNYDPSYCEHLKKTMRGIVRKGNYVTPLNIRLEDLLKADERGKWWVVGSAWEGAHVINAEEKNINKLPNSGADQKLLELARKQRMNTDIRRSIFCIIMAAEDYMDAFEKLQQLYSDRQQREVVVVLLVCCLQERRYNPYYGVLAQKLCQHQRKYQLSIQYSVWDKIKELETMTKQASSNLAQFLAHLIMEKALPLSVLKIIEFSDLNKSVVRFMRLILLSVIMNEDLPRSLEAFQRVSVSPDLRMFRESLRLFIQHFLVRKKCGILTEDEMTTLRERTTEVDKILVSNDSKLKL